MKIITKHNSVNELKAANIVYNIILKYKTRIPLLTNTIKIEPHVIPHSHPILTLNTRPLSSINVDKVYLQLLVHENLHWMRKTPMMMTLLSKKYKDDWTKDSKLRRDLKNKFKSFIEHIIVVFNEINIIKPLLSQREFNNIYFKYSAYKYMNRWVLDNFDRIKEDLTKLKLIWKSRVQKISVEVEEEEEPYQIPVKKESKKKSNKQFDIDIKKYINHFT